MNARFGRETRGKGRLPRSFCFAPFLARVRISFSWEDPLQGAAAGLSGGSGGGAAVGCRPAVLCSSRLWSRPRIFRPPPGTRPPLPLRPRAEEKGRGGDPCLPQAQLMLAFVSLARTSVTRPHLSGRHPGSPTIGENEGFCVSGRTGKQTLGATPQSAMCAHAHTRTHG